MIENNTGAGEKPDLLHAEPVLAVRNVPETVAYWHEVLAFPSKWTWGNPVDHGGVSWYGAAPIQFNLNPALAAVSEGHSIWIRVRNVEALYALHQQNKVAIAVPIQNKPWGSAEYTVKEINGYYVHFSAPVTVGEASAEKPGPAIRIVPRTPTAAEHQQLVVAVGWASAINIPLAETLMASVVYGVVAEDIHTGEAIGCALLLGDNRSFYYVKDVMIHPAWQRKGIGTALMQALTNWFETHAPAHATVGLFTGDHLASFYRQFEFMQACGMYRQAKRT